MHINGCAIMHGSILQLVIQILVTLHKLLQVHPSGQILSVHIFMGEKLMYM